MWAGLAGTLALLGVALLVTGLLSQQHAPAPPRDLGTIPAPGSPAPARHPDSRDRLRRASHRSALYGGVPGCGPRSPRRGPRPLRRCRTPGRCPWPSRPSACNTNLIELGLGPGHTLQVPPLTQAGAQEAGWYDLGPAPGQLGPAVIAGHVDSDHGPGAFFRLGALRPGDRINVTRADGTVALFRVDAVDDYSKDSFPTQQVYGPVSYAGLRVITCGGSFNFQTHHYLSNIVIYATLTGSRPRTTKRAGHSRA